MILLKKKQFNKESFKENQNNNINNLNIHKIIFTFQIQKMMSSIFYKEIQIGKKREMNSEIITEKMKRKSLLRDMIEIIILI